MSTTHRPAEIHPPDPKRHGGHTEAIAAILIVNGAVAVVYACASWSRRTGYDYDRYHRVEVNGVCWSIPGEFGHGETGAADAIAGARYLAEHVAA